MKENVFGIEYRFKRKYKRVNTMICSNKYTVKKSGILLPNGKEIKVLKMDTEKYKIVKK